MRVLEDFRRGSTVIVGAGAVGGFVAARLARAGARVVLVGRPAQVAAIARDGLQVQTDAGVQVERLTARADLAAADAADLVLICVKAYDSERVAQALAPRLPATATVLTLQNGLQGAEILARHLKRTIFAGAVYAAVEQVAPGCVRHAGGDGLVLGAVEPAPAAGTAATAAALAALFTAAGFAVRIAQDMRLELWRKLAVNCAYNAISALGQAAYARMTGDAEVRALMQRAAQEAVAVAQAEGVPLPLAETLEAVVRVADAMPTQKSSMAQDLARGRRTEIEQINGEVVRRGRARGVATPVNDVLAALVRLAEGATRSDDG